MRKYKLVGLTGTTGAGKGLVRKVFEEKGYGSIDADLLAREIMENKVVLKNIACVFGDDVVENDCLNRSLLAQRAFKDKESTALLNSITHPYIGALFIAKVKDLSEKGARKIVFDAPQLFESNLDVMCDSIVSVIANRDLRINRIMARDNITLEKAQRRVNIQLSDDFFNANSDYIIENNRDLESLREQANIIINKL